MLSNMIFCHCAFGTGFLTAQKFPTTYNDVSFADRMQVEAEGYEPFESEFDNDGVCIKNCAYQGITIKQEIERSKIDTQNALRDSLQYEQNKNSLPIDTKKIISANYTQCINRNLSIKPGQSAPWGEPVMGQPIITSKFDMERVHPIDHKPLPHYGIDYGVPMNTFVYTTANGRVVDVWQDEKCGKGLKIQHDDGTYAVYCHLENSLVSTGDKIMAGCAVALSGNSGGSTGPHLHYGLKNKYDKFIDPSDYTGRAK